MLFLESYSITLVNIFGPNVFCSREKGVFQMVAENGLTALLKRQLPLLQADGRSVISSILL